MQKSIWSIVVLFYCVNDAFAASALHDAKFKVGEKFEVTMVQSRRAKQFRVHEKGALSEVNKDSPPTRVKFDVRVTRVDSKGVVLEWQQRPLMEMKVGTTWRAVPKKIQKVPAVKTRLVSLSSFVTIENLREIIESSKAASEQFISKIPKDKQHVYRATLSRQLKTLEDQRVASEKLASQAALLVSAFVAKDGVRTNNLSVEKSGTTDGVRWRKKLTLSEEAIEAGTKFEWKDEIYQKIPKSTVRKSILSANAPTSIANSVDKHLKDEMTKNTTKSGSAVFSNERPTKIFLAGRVTSDPFGKEQFLTSKIEMKLNYVPR